MSSSASVVLKLAPELSGVGELIEKQLKSKLKKAGVAGGNELGAAIVKGTRQVLGQGLTGLEADVQRFGGRVKGRLESSLGSSGETAGKKMGEVAGNAAGRALEAGLSRAAPELGALGARLGQNLSKEFGKLGAEAGRKFAQKVVSVSASVVNRGFTASTGALRDFVTGFREGEAAAASLDSRIGRMGIAIRGHLDGVAARARSVGEQLYNAIGQPVVRAGEQVGRAMRGAAASVGQAVAPITEPFRRAMTSVIDTIAPADSALRRFASGAGQRFSALGVRVRTSLGAAFTKVREGARAAASAVGTAVGNALKTLGTQMSSALSQIGVGDLGQALGSSWGRLDAVDRLRSALQGVTSDGRETERILNSVLGVAGATAFDGAQWANAGRELIQMGVSADRLAPTMAALGEIAASGGKITEDSLTNAVGAFKDLAANGEITSASLSAFGAAAEPIQEHLQNAFDKKSLEELSQAMREGEITTDQVMASIVESVEGGMDGVSGSMVQARGTWEGTMNRIKNAVTGALGDLIEPHKPKIEAGLKKIGEVFDELPAHIDRIIAFVKESGIGQAFAGAFNGVREGLSSLFSTLEQIAPKIQAFFSFIKENKGTIGLLASALIGGVAAFKAVTAATALFNAVMKMNAIGLVVVALAALAAGLVYAYNNSETFREVVDAVFSFVKDIAEDVMGFFTETLPGMWEALKEKAQEFWDGLVGLIEMAWEWIKAIIAHHPFVILFTYWDEIKEVIGQVWDWLVEKTTQVWASIIETITGVAQGIADFLSGIWDSITSAVEAAWTWVTDLISGAWDSILALVGSAVQWVVDRVTSFRDRVVAIFTAVRDRAQEIFTAVRERVVAIVSALRDRAVEAFSAMRDRVRDRIEGLMTTVREIPNKVREAFSNAKTILLQAGKNIITGLIDGVKNMIGSLKGEFSKVTNMIPDWKGPRRVDRRLLTPAGRMIMDGLMGGIDDKLPNLRGQLGDVTGEISSRIVPPSLEVRRHAASTGGPAAAQPTIQVVNHYPQAEPTSATVNRSLQYAAAIGVV